MSQRSGTGGGRRSPERVPREYKVTVRLSAGELAMVTAAADRAGLAVGSFIVQAGLDRAGHRGDGISELERETLGELIRVGGLVRRIGVNLNQAVARLNATGQPGPDLGPAAVYCMKVVDRIDEAAMLVYRRLKQRPVPRGDKSRG
jgi:hypothetical protein